MLRPGKSDNASRGNNWYSGRCRSARRLLFRKRRHGYSNILRCMGAWLYRRDMYAIPARCRSSGFHLVSRLEFSRRFCRRFDRAFNDCAMGECGDQQFDSRKLYSDLLQDGIG